MSSCSWYGGEKMKLYESIVKPLINNAADLLLILGFALVIYGIYLIYYPLSFIVGGIGIIIFAFYVAENKEGDSG